MFLLGGDKLMPEMHLRQPGLTHSARGPFTKNKESIQKFKKQDIQGIFVKTSQIKLVFNMAWLINILKIYLEEQLLIEYCMKKHLILLKISNMMDMEGVLLQWFINFLIKILLVVLLKMRVFQVKNQLKNYTNQLLEHFKNEKYSHLLQTIFGVPIVMICN